MRQWAFLVVRPKLSSSNPNFSKPRNRTANSNLWSRLTHHLLERLKSTIPNLQIYLPKRANSEKLGLGIDNPCRVAFLSLRMNKCLERVNDRHFWNRGVFSYAMIPRCSPNSRVIFSSPHLLSMRRVPFKPVLDILVRPYAMDGSNKCYLEEIEGLPLQPM